MPNNPVISPETFKQLNAQMSRRVRQKLEAMEIGVAELELHNSSLTKTFRIYVTLKRSAHLKALCIAEQIVGQEIEQHFGFRPHACYWRYSPDESVSAVSAAERKLVEDPAPQTLFQG